MELAHSCHIIVKVRNTFFIGAGAGPGGDDPPGDGGGADLCPDGASSSAALPARRVAEDAENVRWR